jgi:hypothetical protein
MQYLEEERFTAAPFETQIRLLVCNKSFHKVYIIKIKI